LAELLHLTRQELPAQDVERSTVAPFWNLRDMVPEPLPLWLRSTVMREPVRFHVSATATSAAKLKASNEVRRILYVMILLSKI
jgi:hypothetical protein